jgi:hypothetical protein
LLLFMHQPKPAAGIKITEISPYKNLAGAKTVYVVRKPCGGRAVDFREAAR